MKKVAFLLGLIFILYLESDENDIVIARTINSDDYSIDKESYCRSVICLVSVYAMGCNSI